MTDKAIEEAIAAARKHIYIGEDRDGDPVMIGVDDGIRAAIAAYEAALWQPIETALRECPVDRSLRPGFGAWTTETMWVRDASGRVFEAWFVEVGAYWWDADGECDCEPVEWMPHPLGADFPQAPKGETHD